jgi:DNA-binding NtrC family response regulator
VLEILSYKVQEKAKILIIDDEKGPRESARLILKDAYVVITATGMAEAFRYMAGDHVDLVILDVIMPEMDGLTALQEIKRRHPKVEVILLTAYAAPETKQKALKFGAFGYLQKPFDKDALLDIVGRALKNQPVRKR